MSLLLLVLFCNGKRGLFGVHDICVLMWIGSGGDVYFVMVSFGTRLSVPIDSCRCYDCARAIDRRAGGKRLLFDVGSG
jgi:hypothetical protein